MITPRQRFTKVYETLTPEKRSGSDQAQTCYGLTASQDLTRIYIYIYSVRSSATGSQAAVKTSPHGSQYRPIPALSRAPRPPCGSRLARDAGHPAHSPHVVTARRVQRAHALRVADIPSAKLLRCYMTAGLRHVTKLIYQKCNIARVTCNVTCQT